MTSHERIPSLSILPSPFVLLAEDGFELAARRFEPLGHARANLLIHAATAAPQTYYASFASHLAERGVRVFTYDYRGVGSSRPASLEGFEASMTDWATLDGRAAFSHVREQYAEVPTLFLGHSFGGQMIGLLDELRDAAGAILVASQLGYMGHFPVRERVRLAAIWYAVVPLVSRALGYLPARGLLGVELPRGVALEWAAWCRHPEYLMGHVDGARDRFASFDRPFLQYSFTDDDFAPERAVDALLAALPRGRRVHRRIDPSDLEVSSIGHFGFFRRPFAESLWDEVGHFIDAVSEGKPPRLPDSPPRGVLGTHVRFEWSDVMADLQAGRA
jgi:predicted alpha/beta hydrolase